MPGRKRKPTALHVVDGTFNVTTHRGRLNEPKPPGNLDKPPAWFSREQRSVWDYGLASAPPNLLKRLDLSIYTVWVIACDMHRQAAEELSKRGILGLIETTTAGNMLQGRLVGIMNRQADLIVKAAGEMGFTPASRSKVSSDPGGAANNDEFFHA